MIQIQEDFCFECNKNNAKKVEKGKIVLAEQEMRDYRKDGGEAIPLIEKVAKCYFSDNSCLYLVKKFDDGWKKFKESVSPDLLAKMISAVIYARD